MRRFNFLLFYCFTLGVWAQGEYLVLKDSTKIYVEVSGEGKTVWFVPGWTMTHRFFEKQQAQLSAEYKVVTYDPRGQGRSDKTTDKNTYYHHAADLRELILQKDMNDLILVGWSSGCLTLFEYLRAFGTKRVHKMIFIDEPPKWIGQVEKEWVYGTFEDYRSSLKRMLSQPSEPNEIIDWMLQNPINDDTRTWMREEILMTPPHVALSLYIDGLASDYSPEVEKLDIPALFMVRRSWYDRARTWLKSTAPHAQITPISSHAAFWERPREFNARLTEFIQSK